MPSPREEAWRESLRRLEREKAHHGEGALCVCDTPTSLVMLGLEQLPMYISPTHVHNIMHAKGETRAWHGIPRETLESLPELMMSPAMMMDAPRSASRKEAVVVMLSELDGDGLPIIVAIKPGGWARTTGVYVPSNYILSAYGREDPEEYVARAAKENRILFIDEKKTESLQTRGQLELLLSAGETPLNSIVHQTKSFNKLKNKESHDNPIPKKAAQKNSPEQDERRARGHDPGQPTQSKTQSKARR